MFVCGGLRGQLVMNKKSWFSYQDNIIHENEGPISTIAYSFPFVAWCTEFGTKIYNVETETRVSYVEKPQNAPDTGACKPRLYWYDNSRLCIGWGSTLTMVKMSFKTTPAGNKVWYGEVGKPLEMDYWIAGVGCFDRDNLTILGYDQPEEGSTVAEPPCVYVVNYLTGECLSEECLPIKGYEEYACNTYQLEMNATQSTTTSTTLFMLSPHAIIRITPRSAQDHVDWAVQHNDYERALQILGDRANGFSQEHVLDMREHHLDYLFSTSQIERAAALCPLYLGKDENMWERWIARFNGLHKLHLLLPHIPLVEPRLPLPVYTLVLNYFLYNDIVSFLHLIRSWPKPIGDENDLYDPYALLELLEKIQKTKHDGAVKEALAELYATTHQFEKAVMIYLDNKLAGVEDTPFFSWVEGNDLIGAVSGHVLQLFRLNSKQASEMLCNHMNDIKVGMNELLINPLFNLFNF